MIDFKKVAGILFDLDGVFYVGNQPIPGGVELLSFLRNAGIPFRFLTNTTTMSRAGIQLKLKSFGLEVDEKEIVSAAYAGVLYLRQQGNPTCALFIQDNAKRDFSEFPETYSDPDLVVLGDLGDDWTYEKFNQIFRLIMSGAKILALHKGRYFQVEDGLNIDAGAYVTGLEFATGKTSVSLGKPNPDFFKLALKDLGVSNSHTIMIGDDLQNDILGAQTAGIRAVLVKTGKYNSTLLANSKIKPDHIVDSITDLLRLLRINPLK